MYEDKNQTWIKWAKKFNAQNKIYPDQDVNNWFVRFAYCRACFDDEALAFQKSEDYDGDIFSALFDEYALDLEIPVECSEERDGCILFEHIPSGLCFWATPQDDTDFKAGKEVYLYGFMPDKN